MDISDRIKEARIASKSFTNSETGEIVDYLRLEIDVDFQGEPETLEIKLDDKKDYKLLKAADIQG